jgi:hypothetical protein
MKKARKTAMLKAYARGEWTSWEEVAITNEMRVEHAQLEHCTHIWANNRFEVQGFRVETAIGGVWQLTAVRHGDIEGISWDELQRIVHELFGVECCAVEVYPPVVEEWHSKVNVRVLWVLPVTWPLPFGLSRPGAWGKPA